MNLYIKRYVVLLGFTMVLLSSCNRVFDDIKQYKSLDPSMVWTDEAFTTQYVNKFYSGLYGDFTKMDAPATEEFGLWQQNAWTQFNTDQIAAGSASGIQAYTSFTSAYSNIRDLNRFFENIGVATFASKNKLKGQAFFMMAHQYFKLVKTYGGVPLVKSVISASSPNPQELGQARNTTLECFNYISQCLDSAIAYLPEPSGPGVAITGYDKFRVTKPIALIYKADVLMWKASPIFNTTPSQAYWQDAYAAWSTVKTWLDSKGYGLYTTSRGLTKPYTAMFYDKAGAKKEWIWAQEFTYPTSNSAGLYKDSSRPTDQGGGNEAAVPTWQLLQRYPMLDGKDTLTSTYAYNDKLFWNNRDPRFKQTFAYNGAKFVFPANPTAIANPNRREWTFTGTIKGNHPFDVTRGGGTGVRQRKGCDTTLHNQQLDQIATNWPIYRYAEVLLSLAECANELDANRSQVVGLLTPIRARAGIENKDGSYGFAGVTDKAAWTKLILNERLIELVYEGKRVWDIKRRVLFGDFRNYRYWYGRQSKLNDAGVNNLKMKASINGKTIVIATLSSNSLSSSDVMKAMGDTLAKSTNPDALYLEMFTDKVIIADASASVLNPHDNNALEPIPSGVLLTDPKVVQSKNYGGTFDPKFN